MLKPLWPLSSTNSKRLKWSRAKADLSLKVKWVETKSTSRSHVINLMTATKSSSPSDTGRNLLTPVSELFRESLIRAGLLMMHFVFYCDVSSSGTFSAVTLTLIKARGIICIICVNVLSVCWLVNKQLHRLSPWRKGRYLETCVSQDCDVMGKHHMCWCTYRLLWFSCSNRQLWVS